MIRRCTSVLFILGVSLAACCPVPIQKETLSPLPTLPTLDLASFFEGYDGCFVLWDVTQDKYVYHNRAMCSTQLSPCSTYKIPHALIALETGVIPDQHHVIEWNGTQYPIETWNQDHTMASAVQNSVVWYFQAVAADIGPTRMQEYLDLFDYGNKDISGGLDQFWLGRSLKISAEEQIDFLHRLDTGYLPITARSMDIVKEVITLEETDTTIYRGKTGSCTPEGEHPLGWFVGTVSQDDHTYVFATNIQAVEANGRQARQISEEILQYLDVLP
jgi:beta-lactamase class D